MRWAVDPGILLACCGYEGLIARARYGLLNTKSQPAAVSSSCTRYCTHSGSAPKIDVSVSSISPTVYRHHFTRSARPDILDDIPPLAVLPGRLPEWGFSDYLTSH